MELMDIVVILLFVIVLAWHAYRRFREPEDHDSICDPYGPLDPRDRALLPELPGHSIASFLLQEEEEEPRRRRPNRRRRAQRERAERQRARQEDSDV